jgi:hypothetical protein
MKPSSSAGPLPAETSSEPGVDVDVGKRDNNLLDRQLKKCNRPRRRLKRRPTRKTVAQPELRRAQRPAVAAPLEPLHGLRVRLRDICPCGSCMAPYRASAGLLVIEHAVTADMQDGQPLPPYNDQDTIWRVVRRADGLTSWRRIFLRLTNGGAGARRAADG